MELFQRVISRLFRKRKLFLESNEENEILGGEETYRRKKRKLEEDFLPFLRDNLIMSTTRKGYSSVVSWLFPQLAPLSSFSEMSAEPIVAEITDDEDIDEIEIVKEVKSKGNNPVRVKSEAIEYDPLPDFAGFTQTRGPSLPQISHLSYKNRLERSKGKKKLKPVRTLRPESKFKLSSVLNAREIYRKMLEKVFASNFQIPSNQIGHFEEYLKEHSMNNKPKSQRGKNHVPEVVEVEDNSDDDDVKILEEDEIQILNDLSKLKTEIELVDLEDHTNREQEIVDIEDYINKEQKQEQVVELTDESDLESEDEDEKYYDNRTFVRKECDIVYDSSEDDDDDEDEKYYDSRTSLQNDIVCLPSHEIKAAPEIVQLDNEDINDGDNKVDEVKLRSVMEARTSSQLPLLTQAMLDVIARSENSNKEDVLVDAHGIKIRREHILTLRGLNWLNDEIINFYLSMIATRSLSDASLPSVYSFSTFFYPRLYEGGHSSVARWTRNQDLFSYSLLLVPIHLGMHWCLAAVDLRAWSISYYDSMGGNNTSCLSTLDQYLREEYSTKTGQTLSPSTFNHMLVKSAPKQLNGSDCGIFACKYAEYLSRGARLTFSQTDMPYFRKRMVWEIVSNTLLAP